MKKYLSSYPNLVKEWHPKKNGDLSPKSISYGSKKKIWWVCNKGHEWEASVQSRSTRNTNCPYCSGNKVSKENSFSNNFPNLLKYWSLKNILKPNEVTYKSNKKVLWNCDKGHEWEAVISSLANGTGCPYCANKKIDSKNNFASKFPEKVKFWDYTKNKEDPKKLAPGSSKKKYWFICENNHSFDITLNNLTSLNRWCPFCAGKKVTKDDNLLIHSPKICEEWNYKKNKENPENYKAKSNKKVWCICNKGHEWEAVISSRANGSSCPFCSNRKVFLQNSLSYLYPDLAKEYDYKKNIVKDASLILAGTRESVWWKCIRGHSWKTSVANRTIGKTNCPKCSKQTSLPEIRVFSEIKHLFNDTKHREKIASKEADILIPSFKLVIEYDGYYYHKNKLSEDRKKTDDFLKLGYQVVRLRCSPLEIWNSNQIQVPENGVITKEIINSLLKLISNLVTIDTSLIKNYLVKEHFQNDKDYKKIISYLPAPEPEKSLKFNFPEISNEWDYEKNYPLLPSMFSPRSGLSVWWKCINGHSWKTTLDKRVSGRNCPVCSHKVAGHDYNLAVINPDLASQWYQPQNGNITPYDVTPKSDKKFWWVCKKNHFHFASISDKSRRNTCPFCKGKGRSRKYTAPDFLS